MTPKRSLLRPRMTERWVINASPLIVLARIGYERLLCDLPDQAVIPQAVASEIEVGPQDDPARRRRFQTDASPSQARPAGLSTPAVGFHPTAQGPRPTPADGAPASPRSTPTVGCKPTPPPGKPAPRAYQPQPSDSIRRPRGPVPPGQRRPQPNRHGARILPRNR